MFKLCKIGSVLFSNVAFKGVGDYLPVDAGTYNLEVRLAGTSTVALEVAGLKLDAGTVYTVFAMGLAGGQPALTAVPSVDATSSPAVLPTTGAGISPVWILVFAGSALIALGGGLRMRPNLARVQRTNR